MHKSKSLHYGTQSAAVPPHDIAILRSIAAGPSIQGRDFNFSHKNTQKTEGCLAAPQGPAKRPSVLGI